MIDEKLLMEEIQQRINHVPKGEKVDSKFYFNCGFNNALIKIYDFVQSQPKVGEWIPCSSGVMPDREDGLYWTTHEDGSVILHGYSKEHGFIYNWEVDNLCKREKLGQVIAWYMIPLPQPYREKVE